MFRLSYKDLVLFLFYTLLLSFAKAKKNYEKSWSEKGKKMYYRVTTEITRFISKYFLRASKSY